MYHNTKLLLKKDGSPFLYEGFHLVAWHSLNFGWWVMVQLNVDTLVQGIWRRLAIICDVYHLHFWTKPNKKSVAILSFCSPGCKVRAMPLFSWACHFKFAKCRRNIWIQALSATFKWDEKFPTETRKSLMNFTKEGKLSLVAQIPSITFLKTYSI